MDVISFVGQVPLTIWLRRTAADAGLSSAHALSLHGEWSGPSRPRPVSV